MADVRLKNVNKSFGETKVLHDINLEIKDGEFMVFVGPSGCGKSTLLRAIAGLEDITSGELQIGGKVVNDVPPAERGIAMVFQSYALYPHMSLYDNMAFGLKLAKMPQPEIDKAVHGAAKILNIDHLLDRKPKALSGGQRQRVAIGRAIVREPEVFLFDEPLSNLDAALRVRMRYEFAKLHENLKTTMVYVTHDQVEAMTLADRIAIMKDGAIQQLASPHEIYHRPTNLFVAGFIGSPSMNFVSGEIVASDGGPFFAVNGQRIALDRYPFVSPPVPGPATLGLRPEHIAADGAFAGFHTTEGQVSVVEPMGADTIVWFEWAEQTMSLRLMGEVDFKPGDAISPGFDIAKASLFAADGTRM